jgi:hypothetical protein
MSRVNVLTVLATILAVFTLGVWIGRQWFPPHELEVVDGLVVEKRCYTWTERCNYLGRGFNTAIYCERPKRYRCLMYSWW